MTNMNILHLHSGGQTAFDSEDIRAYGSLENLIASDVLAGIANREASLASLWEAAKMPPVDIEALTNGQQAYESAATEGKEAADA